MITEDELEQIAGERDKLVGKIQERYGLEREEAEREVQTFEANRSAQV